MASSSPSSDPSDAEDFNRENKSTLKLPGDCLPSKELPSCKEIILLEDMTPTVGSSGDLIRPVQGRWGPEGKKRWPDLQQLPLNDPQQISKPGVSVAWADNNGFEESTAHEKQCSGKKCPKQKTNRARPILDGLVKLLNAFQSLDWNVEGIEDEEIYNYEKLQRKKDEDCDFLEHTMAEDLRRSNCLPAQLSHQEHEVRLESAMRKPSGNTDVGPFPELPGTPKGRERAERAGEASSTRESGTTEPSTSSAHLEDDTPRPPGTASRLVGRAFRWLHRIAVPRGRGPEQATGSCPQRAPRGSGWLRGKRVPPDGSPGQFRPRMPTFSRYVLLRHEKYEEEDWFLINHMFL